MSEKRAEEVVIIGGGVFGFSIAYHLAKEGIPSQIIEMDSIGAKASGKADGMISTGVGSFFYSRGAKRLLSTSIPLIAESYRRFPQLYLELKEETGLDIQYATYPFFECALSEEEEKTLINIASEARSVGLGNVKWISGDEVRASENIFSAEVRGAVLLDCAQVEPYRYTLALAQGAEKLGASIRYAQAVGFRFEKSRVTSVILSSGSEVAAGRVIITMGPWSGQAAFWLGLRLPITSFRAQTLRLMLPKAPKYHAGFKPQAVSACRHAYMIVAPRVEFDGTTLVGYTEDRTESWDDSRPDTWTDSPTEKMRELILEQALRFVPALEDAMLVEHRAGVLGDPPGEKIVIGPVPRWDNVYMAAIGDGGIARSPVVGRIMTDLIVGGDRSKRAMEEVKAINPSRFMS